MEVKLANMEEQYYQRYERAKKAVKRKKSFYRHVIVYLIIMAVLFFTRYVIFPKIGFYYPDKGFKNWLDLNTYGLAIVWLIVILIQGVFVLKPKKISDWEAKKIQEIIAEEEATQQQKWK